MTTPRKTVTVTSHATQGKGGANNRDGVTTARVTLSAPPWQEQLTTHMFGDSRTEKE